MPEESARSGLPAVESEKVNGPVGNVLTHVGEGFPDETFSAAA